MRLKQLFLSKVIVSLLQPVGIVSENVHRPKAENALPHNKHMVTLATPVVELGDIADIVRLVMVLAS